EDFSRTVVELNVGGEYDFENLGLKLRDLGFEKKDFVETYGDYAVRGGILDVFPFAGENPVRYEFWGNTVESIREFDVLSQRSIRELKSAGIVPSLTSDPSVAADGPVRRPSVFDYLREDTVVIFDSPAFIRREIEELLIERPENRFDADRLFREAERF